MNEASKHLYVTQQNLSSSIKQLENELELKILERSSKGVELTEDGKYINELGKAIVEYVAKIEDYAQHQKNLKKKNIVGRINIAITQYYANTKMPDLISNFCEKNPEVDVDIYVESSLSIVEQLITNKINLGLVNFDDFHLFYRKR